jgi:signal transduction histidine kinase
MQVRCRPATQGRSGGGSGLPRPLGGARRRGHGQDPDAARIVEILSHELRSPITSISLGTKVLRDGRPMSVPVRNEVVAAVDEEAGRLSRVVEDLIAVARHEDEGLALPVRPLALRHWLPAVIDAEVQADARLRVRTMVAPDLPPVLADDGALAQVVRNLLANAARHATDGMPVEVVVTPAEPGWVSITVLDRGPGLEATEAERLFEPFYRAAAAEAAGSGAGLGLAAARSLLRAMGGTVHAFPRDGGGARFMVRLPVAPADEEPVAAADEDPVAGPIRAEIR